MIQVKEEFLACAKYRRARKLGGDAAIVMWLAMKGYAATRPRSEGFVPDDEIDGLLGAPSNPRKALRALVECGQLEPDGVRGSGLVDAVEGGWQLHDYADHAEAPEVTELRREKTRQRVQQHREQKRRELDRLRDQTVTPDVTPVTALQALQVTPDVTPETSVTPCARERPRERGGGRARVRGACVRASPTQPNPTQPDQKLQQLQQQPIDAQGAPMVWFDLRDFVVPDQLYAEAEMQGLSREAFDRRLRRLRNRRIGGRDGVIDRIEYVRQLIPTWRTWEETDRARAATEPQAEPAEEHWL